jgi:hypothetical protein
VRQAKVVGLLPRDSANEYELSVLGVSPLETEEKVTEHAAAAKLASSKSEKVKRRTSRER